MEDGVEIMEKVINTSTPVFSKLEGFVKLLESKLELLTRELGVIATEKVLVFHEALRTFDEVRNNLRRARQSLKKLSMDTVRACKKLIVLTKGWDSSVSIERQKGNLLRQMNIIKLHLETSKRTLVEVDSQYDDSRPELQVVDDKLDEFKRLLDEMLNKHSDKYKSWTAKFRAGVYTCTPTYSYS